MATGSALTALAGEAPAGPGVYFLLAEDGELLYIGKAASLRRRLLDHIRGAPLQADPRAAQKVAMSHEVRWIECTDERDALCREADLIVALSPRLNAVMAGDASMFVASTYDGGRLRLELSESAGAYGAFPHVGKGKASWRAKRSNAGYSALMRLLSVAFRDPSRIPAKLRGTSPPAACEITVDPHHKSLVHDFFSGRSRRVLDVLARAIDSDDVPVFMRGPLTRDIEEAEEFYELGPDALRKLRRRHGLAPGPVDKDTFTMLMRDELRDAIGEFTLRGERPGRVLSSSSRRA